jgi:hypothetical protein
VRGARTPRFVTFDIPMNPDKYTKTLLTAIAVLLIFITIRPLVNPDTQADAQGAPPRGWEYTFVWTTPTDEVLQDGKSLGNMGASGYFRKANELGSKGWELVTTERDASGNQRFIFKRAKP